MNNQQELINAINSILNNRNTTYDTPAEVLRVDGDTVWVHIDGGADETPVLKTINCEQGEKVQVRISNGSAFLVGNASAPPTDDKRANAAHFVAEQAEVEAADAQNKANVAQETAATAQETAEEAMTAVAQSLTSYQTWYKLSATTPTQPTEDSHTGWSTTEPAWSSSSTDNLYFSIRTVTGDGTITWSAVGMVQSYADLVILKNAIISTVASDYVAQGNSNITSLSSTMLQNVHGVNVYNGTLAVGDSYAHIDGDSFDIKNVTTAGTIDDTNDTVVASFGATSKISQIEEDELGYDEGYEFTFDSSGLELEFIMGSTHANTVSKLESDKLRFSEGSTGLTTKYEFGKIFDGSAYGSPYWPGNEDTYLYYVNGRLFASNRIQVGLNPKVTIINGDILGNDGESLFDEWTPAVTASTSGSNVVAVFDNLDDSYGYFPYFEDELITVTAVTKGTGTQTGTIKLTYTLQGATSGTTQCYLRIMK